MPDKNDILTEFEKLKDTFENKFILPWQTESTQAMPWSHAIMRVAMSLQDDLLKDVVRGLLRSESFALRAVGIWLVGAHSLENMAPQLIERIQEDVSVPVRAMAVSSLTSLGPDHTAAFLDIPDDENGEIKTVALAAFKNHPSPENIACAERWLNRKGEAESVCMAAIAVLASVRTEQTSSLLIAQLLNNEVSDGIRGAAAEALGDSPFPAAVEALTTTCEDNRHWVRARSILALAKIDPVASSPFVHAGVGAGQNWMVRTHAVAALQFSDGDSASVVDDLVTDSEPSVRSEIAVLLGKKSVVNRRTHLLRLLGDDEFSVQIHACASTENILDRSFGLSDEIGKPNMDMKAVRQAIADARGALEVKNTSE